ncbi:MAG: hypothetical protein ACI3Y3_07370, partial [Candidatus Cryptobacteroides sp.]
TVGSHFSEICGNKITAYNFELTRKDYLNEAKDGELSRGSQCTSVDAAIVVKREASRIRTLSSMEHPTISMCM